MAWIQAECPNCRQRNSLKNDECSGCLYNLARAKRNDDEIWYWVIDRNQEGKQVKINLRSRGLDPFSYEDAKAVKRALEDAEYERKPKFIDRKKWTFNQLAEWYLDLDDRKNKRSYNTIKIKITNFNADYGELKVNDLKVSHLRSLQTRREKQGDSANTVDQELSKVRTMVRFAVDDDMIGANVLKVFDKVEKKLVKGEDVRDRILEPDEFAALIEHADEPIKQIVTIAYYTGIRKREILKLTWDRVDLQKGFIYLDQEQKTEKRREVPILPPLYDMLASMPNRLHKAGEDNHVVQYKGKPIKFNFDRSLKKACEKAGIIYGKFVKDGFILHDLRHTFNTNMSRAGVPETVIMEITGHSTREMFDRYRSVKSEDKQDAAERLNDYFVAQMLPKQEKAEHDAATDLSDKNDM